MLRMLIKNMDLSLRQFGTTLELVRGRLPVNDVVASVVASARDEWMVVCPILPSSVVYVKVFSRVVTSTDVILTGVVSSQDVPVDLFSFAVVNAIVVGEFVSLALTEMLGSVVAVTKCVHKSKSL